MLEEMLEEVRDSRKQTQKWWRKKAKRSIGQRQKAVAAEKKRKRAPKVGILLFFSAAIHAILMLPFMPFLCSKIVTIQPQRAVAFSSESYLYNLSPSRAATQQLPSPAFVEIRDDDDLECSNNNDCRGASSSAKSQGHSSRPRTFPAPHERQNDAQYTRDTKSDTDASEEEKEEERGRGGARREK
jgi:hypothetical protein